VISGGTIPDLRKFEGSDQDYLNTVRDGRQGTIMPAWKEFLTDEEILKIRAYTKSVGIS
jgi:mono/diheme cytochrome c family protein